jgi:hypothetical protein
MRLVGALAARWGYRRRCGLARTLEVRPPAALSPQKGATGMTGPSLALIIIPIVATAGLVAWVTMVFSADGHPRQADRNPVGTHASTPGKTGERLPTAPATMNPPIETAASYSPVGSSAPGRDSRIRRSPAR